VAISSGLVVGFEALLRWRTETGRIGEPAQFEAAFEDAEVAAAISDRMIDRVIADMRMWLDRGSEFQHVAVNASAAEFRRDNFAERVLDQLRLARIPTNHFQLEVTETVFLGRGAEYVHRALALLNSRGVKIALDDFGTGYASLRHLKQFPVDIIKIDQSFVRDMADDPNDEAIIRAVINLGRSLGIKVVAEGIVATAVVMSSLGHEARADFTREVGFRILNEIITGARAEAQAVVDGRHGVMHTVEARVTVEALGEEIVVLRKGVSGTGGTVRVVGLLIGGFAVGAVGSQGDFGPRTLAFGLDVRREEQGLAVAAREWPGRAAGPIAAAANRAAREHQRGYDHHTGRARVLSALSVD
jgi:EAL domain-containing protein (putative c-di-GMP-specific phosphodiesterase class I)